MTDDPVTARQRNRRLLRQYRIAWKQLAHNAAGCGEAAVIDADNTLSRDILTDAFYWVSHKAGDVSDHTLVYHPRHHDAVTDPDIVGPHHYWTGDAGVFDTAEVIHVDQYGPITLRADHGIPPRVMAVIELSQMTMTGRYHTATHTPAIGDQNQSVNTTMHPYAVITQLPTDE